MIRTETQTITIQSLAAAEVVEEIVDGMYRKDLVAKATRVKSLLRGCIGLYDGTNQEPVERLKAEESTCLTGLLQAVAGDEHNILADAAAAVLVELTDQTTFWREIAQAKDMSASSFGFTVPDDLSALVTTGEIRSLQADERSSAQR